MAAVEVGPRAAFDSRPDLPRPAAADHDLRMADPQSAQPAQNVISDHLRSSQIIPDQDRYRLAYECFDTRIWTDDDMADVLSISPNTVRKIRAAWKTAGLVISGGSQGRWQFVRQELQ